MSAFHDIILAGAAGQQGYKISRSVRLRSSASAYFNRTPASASNRQTMTFSCWLKRCTLGANQSLFVSRTVASPYAILHFLSDQLVYEDSNPTNLITTQVFRDPSAWYHVVLSIDTTQATAANRVKLYVNGVQITSFGTATYPAQNANTNYNVASAHYISSQQGPSVVEYFDGYLTEVNFIDGQALTPSSFGQNDPVTGVWQPKKYAGTYGTNGFYLNFSDPSAATAAAIGKDNSGNGNNWTPNNISVTAGVTYDSMIDVPTMWADGGNGRGNYAVLNPLFLNSEVSATLSNGNLTMTTTTATNGVGGQKMSSIFVTSGKWYAEVSLVNGGANYQYLGVQNSSGSTYAILGIASITNSAIINGSSGNQTGLGFATNGDVIGISLDADAGIVRFFKNNVQIGSNQSIATGVELGFLISAYYSSGTCATHTNFGQRPFTYTPPTGFKALNTQNLPDSTIKAGNKYFDATTYTGTGSARSITNAGAFQPDFVWLKPRSAINDNLLFDSSRGVTAFLKTNATNAEATDATTLTSFNSNGFSIGTSGGLNANGTTMVGWQWKAGGAPVTNNVGSISAQVSANATAGFSIVTYTGTGANATVGHGLGVAPKMIICKKRTSSPTATDWTTWHTAFAGTEYILLNTTQAKQSAATPWNSTVPSSSVFNVGNDQGTNASGQGQLAYLFSEVAGFSKFGSYTGNGSADGPFVFTNFQPRFVMVKRTDTTSNWIIKDTTRSPSNTALQTLYPNLSNAEGSGDDMDVLSNGFKMRLAGSTNLNASGGTYIFAAFAENPAKYALAR